MGKRESASILRRRSFLARFGAGRERLWRRVRLRARRPRARSQRAAAGSRWQPTRHAEDDWFEQVSAKHRIFFDTTTADGFGQAILFANNTFTANRTGYGLTDADVAIVICARHHSTPFAYTDALWAKYGSALAERAHFNDPRTKEPPKVNVFQTAGYDTSLPNNGLLLDAVIKRGVRLAVCGLATRAAASLIAQKTGGKVDDIFKELTDHMVPNAHLVPAGIVAVNRAQERGYSIASVG